MKKKIIAITIDQELHDFFKKYVKLRKKTVSGMISEHVFDISSSYAKENNS